MKSNLSIILAISAAFVAAPLGRAAVLVNTTQTRAIFDLTGYTGAGFEPGADTATTGRLDSNDVRVGGVSDGDTDFGDTQTTGDFARGTSTGNVTDGGFYMFDTPETTFGIQPDDTDWNNSTSYVDILFENNTGKYINNISVEGQLWHINNGDRASHIRMQLSLNGTDFIAIGGVSSPEGATATGWSSSFLINDVPIITSYLDPGAQFIVRVSGFDVSGTGDRDEFGFSDLAVILRNQSLPEPRTMGFLVLGVVGLRYTRERRKKYGYHVSDAAKRMNSIRKKIEQSMRKATVSDSY